MEHLSAALSMAFAMGWEMLWVVWPAIAAVFWSVLQPSSETDKHRTYHLASQPG